MIALKAAFAALGFPRRLRHQRAAATQYCFVCPSISPIEMSASSRVLPRLTKLVKEAVSEGETKTGFGSASPGGRGDFKVPKLSASAVNSIMLALKDLDASELGVNGRSSISNSSASAESIEDLPIGFCFVGAEPGVFEASIFVLPPNARIPGASNMKRGYMFP